MQIYELISKVMKDVGSVAKNQRNKDQGYNFRGIDDMYQAAHPAMVAHGVFCAPEVTKCELYRFEKTNREGKVTTWVHASLVVKHNFFAPDGSCVSVTTCGEGLDNSDKATNKAMSGAMKYAYIELLCIPTKDIADADRDSPEAGMATNVEKTESDIPVNGTYKPESDMITTEQAQKLHMRFRAELREEIKAQSEELLHEFLRSELFVDPAGKPSAKAIPKADFAAVGKKAVQIARGL